MADYINHVSNLRRSNRKLIGEYSVWEGNKDYFIIIRGVLTNNWCQRARSRSSRRCVCCWDTRTSRRRRCTTYRGLCSVGHTLLIYKERTCHQSVCRHDKLYFYCYFILQIFLKIAPFLLIYILCCGRRETETKYTLTRNNNLWSKQRGIWTSNN